MKVLIFGATGMVGRGVLRECLPDPDTESAVSIGRTPLAEDNPAPRDSGFRQIVHRDLQDLSGIESGLTVAARARARLFA